MNNNNPNNKFDISVEKYSNKGLTLFLDIRIKSKKDIKDFDVIISLVSELTLEDELMMKDAYTVYKETKVISNELLPKNELDFFEAGRNYRIDKYSIVAQEFYEEVTDFLSDVLFNKLQFKAIIKE